MVYDRYAEVYDASGQVRFTLLVMPYLRELLHTHPVIRRRMLDLACGTGTLALMLAGEGWDVLGLDTSAAMLDQARAKAANADVAGSAAFVQGDMRCVSATIAAGGVDLVTCLYDSLNYMLTSDDLRACFASAAYALADGGLFIGDMNTQHFLQHGWGDHEVHEHQGYVQVERSHFDAERNTVTMALTGFVGNDSDGYERFDETHSERAYDPAEVTQLLEQVGFTVEAVYTAFTNEPPAPAAPRLVWVARKRANTTSDTYPTR